MLGQSAWRARREGSLCCVYWRVIMPTHLSHALFHPPALSLSLPGLLSGRSVRSFAEIPFWVVVSFAMAHKLTDSSWNHSPSNDFFPFSLCLWLHTFVLIWYHSERTVGGKGGNVCSVHPCEPEHILYKKRGCEFRMSHAGEIPCSSLFSTISYLESAVMESYTNMLLTRWSLHSIYSKTCVLLFSLHFLTSHARSFCFLRL